MIIVAGEALIDRIVQPDGREVAVPGGGPFNTARTIGRLDGEVAFLGRLSTDRSGMALRAMLAADGVDLRWIVSTDAPTTEAIAELDAHGAASYRFQLDGTAAPGLEPADVLSALRSEPAAVHVGSLGLVAEPIASALEAGMAAIGPTTLVMVDPNCRSQAIVDREAYLGRLHRVLSRADVVKLSADDLAYIAPELSLAAAARALLALGPIVILLTDGPRTGRVIGRRTAFDIEVPTVAVVDTVGAGDAFGGAFLVRFMERSGARAGLGDGSILRDAVAVAVAVAAETCRRTGADPPRRGEIDWPLD
ncbi:MAG TPA: PfkB family carbohydrate kinase [Candidatus Saccharimonadia bacterium]|nr:PfkB family carbohydrate kinase [Candidatus Saccharimonadia bacterium]